MRDEQEKETGEFVRKAEDEWIGQQITLPPRFSPLGKKLFVISNGNLLNCPTHPSLKKFLVGSGF